MTQLSRLNKADLITRIAQAEEDLKELQEQRTVLFVVLGAITLIQLLF